jgi:mannose-6-phosphate isomerase-like protein (cupin superfamily)
MMETIDCEIKRGSNFTMANLGEFARLDRFCFKLPSESFEFEGKLFINQLLGLTSCEISFNKLQSQTSIPFYHKHQLNEEIYIFLQGKGEFQIDGKVFPVSEGTVVRVAPEGERTLRSNPTGDLYYIVIQARANSYESNTIMDGLPVDKRVSWVNKEPA